MSIAVDLDGTLLKNYGQGVFEFGEPVPAMLERVKAWVAQGQDVVIFTARIHQSGPHAEEVAKLIGDWTEQVVGKRLRATGTKEVGIHQIWDDRAVAVEFNTGRILGGA